MSLELPEFSLPQIPPERQFSKKFFFVGVAEGEWSIFSICFDKEQQTLPTR
jgi:hypothetical protein